MDCLAAPDVRVPAIHSTLILSRVGSHALPESLLRQAVLKRLLAAATLAQLLRALQTFGKTESLLLCEKSYREGGNWPNRNERIRKTARLRVFPLLTVGDAGVRSSPLLGRKLQ